MYRYLNIINPFFNFKPIVYENLMDYKKIAYKATLLPNLLLAF